MSEQQTRRPSNKTVLSFGSHTMNAVSRALLKMSRKPRSPQRDLEDLQMGATLKVFCMTWSLGTPRTMKLGQAVIPMRNMGYLHLASNAPTAWHGTRNGDIVAIPNQATLKPSDRQLINANLVAYTLVIGDAEHDIAVPKTDVALVEQVIGGPLNG